MSDHQGEGAGSYPLHYVALGLLLNGPRHGYLLYQDFVRDFHLIWKSKQSKFYAALAALEASRQLKAHTEPQEGRPARKVYQITDAGRAAFLEWLHRPVNSMRSFRVEFIARLRFFRLLGLPGAGALIDQQVAYLSQLRDEWQEIASLDSDLSDSQFPDALNDFRRRQAQAMIDWLMAWREQFEGEATPR